MPRDVAPKTAILYRMALDDHLCPSGLKAKALLENEGYETDDRPLTTRARMPSRRNTVSRRPRKSGSAEIASVDTTPCASNWVRRMRAAMARPIAPSSRCSRLPR